MFWQRGSTSKRSPSPGGEEKTHVYIVLGNATEPTSQLQFSRRHVKPQEYADHTEENGYFEAAILGTLNLAENAIEPSTGRRDKRLAYV